MIKLIFVFCSLPSDSPCNIISDSPWNIYLILHINSMAKFLNIKETNVKYVVDIYILILKGKGSIPWSTGSRNYPNNYVNACKNQNSVNCEKIRAILSYVSKTPWTCYRCYVILPHLIGILGWYLLVFNKKLSIPLIRFK